jgi:hypothetical protein
VLDAVLLRSPFLTADQAAFFLQVSESEARRAYEASELPSARRLDGGLFQPTPGARLVPYEELHALLEPRAQAMLDLWQVGRFDIPRPALRDAAPVTFNDVLASLAASETASNEVAGAPSGGQEGHMPAFCGHPLALTWSLGPALAAAGINAACSTNWPLLVRRRGCDG